MRVRIGAWLLLDPAVLATASAVAGQVLSPQAISSQTTGATSPAVADARVGATIDRLGHGLVVTAAIQELASEAEILPIQVFREGLRAFALALTTAIGGAADHGPDCRTRQGRASVAGLWLTPHDP